MAITFRAASGGQSSTAALTASVTQPAGAVAGDLVLVAVNIKNSTSDTFQAVTGWTLSSQDANAFNGTSPFKTAVYWRVLDGTESWPVSFTWTATTAKFAWNAIAFTPGAGNVLVIDGEAAVKVDTTGASTHTANAQTAVAGSVCSVIINCGRTSAASATAITATPPASWTEPANADQSTASSSTAALSQLGVESCYRLAQSGTVTPGSSTWSQSTIAANVYHFLLAEQAIEDSSALELSGFGADTLVHSYDTINSVKVTYTHHETAGTLAPTLQLWDYSSTPVQIGTTFTCTTGTSDHADTATFTSISYSQLATLRVRVFAHGVTGKIESADAVGIVVNYTAGTPPPATQAIVNAAPKLPPRRISYVSPQVIFGPVAVTGSSPALTDSGAGTDALAVASAAPLAESGAGADALAASAAVPLTDSGSGSDVLAAPAGVSLAEAGSGADALALTAAVPLAEAGSGADALAVAQPTTLTDSGTGTDLLAVAQPVALTDSGTGTDALAITAAVPLAEAGSGSDALTAGPGTPAALTDTGAGSDALSVTVQAPLSEAGAGTDLLTAAAQAGLADSGAGTDALAAPAAVVLADSGAATDALAVAAAAQLTDSGTGSDAVTAGGGTPVALTDSGTGTDVLSVTAHAALPEAGAGSDALATASGIVKTDTDSCTASESGFAFITSADAGTAGDGAEVIVVRDADSCAMAERELTRWPRDSDLCTAAEAAWQSGPVPGGTDACAASDGRELITLASSDACQAADTAPDIEVYTYVPPFRTGPGGGWYKVAWGDTEVLRVPRADGAVLRFAAALARASAVRVVTDADCCSAAESSRQVTGVSVSVVPALEMTIAVCGDIPGLR